MVDTLLSHGALHGLRRVALMTRNAHALYARFGFAPAAAPQMYMERVRPNAYANAAPPPTGALAQGG